VYRPKIRGKLPTVIKYFRTAAVSSFLFGAATLLLGYHYWWGVSSLYAFFLVAALDVWFGPDLRKLWMRLTGTCLVLLLVGFFILGIVVVPAPLHVAANVNLENYGTGAQIAGKKWQPEWVDLRVHILNPTDYEYSNLDLPITPDLYLVDVWQKTAIPNVSFLETTQFDIRQTPINPAGPTQESAQRNITRGVPIRVWCPLLPKHPELEIIMAIENLVPTPRNCRHPLLRSRTARRNFLNG
jgi:hypothetical protein